MVQEKRPFSGNFIKHKNYIEYDFLLESGFVVTFDDGLYRKVSRNVIKILGKKKKYTVADAVFYFQTKYLAYRIPWEYAPYYEDPSFDKAYLPYSVINFDPMDPYYDFKFLGEKSIGLAIDTVFNKNLRRKYSDIETLEKEYMDKYGHIVHSNPVIVIGYYQENVINSMLRFNNYGLTDGEYSRRNISEIDYEMYFFCKHS